MDGFFHLENVLKILPHNALARVPQPFFMAKWYCTVWLDQICVMSVVHGQLGFFPRLFAVDNAAVSTSV